MDDWESGGRRILWWGALLGVGLSIAGVEGQGKGKDDCPCTEFHGLSKYLDENKKLTVRLTGESAGEYKYDGGYGSVQCKAWDEEYPPYCADESGRKKDYAPAWCAQEWCYVDKENCANPMVFESGYFPGEGLYYSYATCGSKNSFTNWVEGGGMEGEGITSLVGLVGGYCKAGRDGLQDAYRKADSTALAKGDCSLTSGCSCTSCRKSKGWGEEKVDFTDTTVLTKDGEFRCLANLIRDTYMRVANLEYDDNTRIGYQYFGYQVDGSFLQWPAMDWCPGNYGGSGSAYDPRFRDWYAGTASGPKDVVMVIDNSGSMKMNDRMGLAKGAASKVLDTLTWVDFVSVVTFSSDALKASKTLVPCDEAQKAKLNSFISGIEPKGSTNFKAALDAARDIFTASKGDSCLSSGCNGALLFLTDGQPDDWGDSDYNNVRSWNSDNYVKFFTFGLGSGSKMDILDKLAAQNGGFSKLVEDGGNLGDAMSAYYLIFSDVGEQEAVYNRLSWVTYKDWITKTELLAGCMPVFDRRESKPVLMGVNCMDINMVVAYETLKAHPQFPDFEKAYSTASRQCLNGKSPGELPDISPGSKCHSTWEDSWEAASSVDSAFRQAWPSSALFLLSIFLLLPARQRSS